MVGENFEIHFFEIAKNVRLDMNMTLNVYFPFFLLDKSILIAE